MQKDVFNNFQNRMEHDESERKHERGIRQDSSTLSLLTSIAIQQNRRILQLEERLGRIRSGQSSSQSTDKQMGASRAVNLLDNVFPPTTTNKKSPVKSRGQKVRSARYWTAEEHSIFLSGLKKYGTKNFKAIAAMVKTRTHIQVRTHHQKYLIRMRKQLAGSENHQKNISQK